MCVSHSHTQGSGSNVENLPPQVVRKVSKEVVALAEDPPEGIKVFLNEEDITDIQATIEGPGEWAGGNTLTTHTHTMPTPHIIRH